MSAATRGAAWLRSRARPVAVVATALAARLAVVGWGASRFPPTADGTFYDGLAQRIAQGLGYSWVWEDGRVTSVAHYPVGYPALLATVYALGAGRAGGMALNAAFGGLAAYAAYALVARATTSGSRAPLAAGLLVAVHPGLVFYTPAFMTEGVAGALIAAAAAVAGSAWGARRERLASVVTGAVLGVATLVRPQSILFAPAFGGWPGRGARGVVWGAAIATAAALTVCAPWTARNCALMDRCALVSMNGGWNLLIGTNARAGGGWLPLETPAACSEVWPEGEKNACFERAAIGVIADRPAAWLALVPRKLAATFDYAGAAGWYLHASNPEAFPDSAKTALGAVETLFERGLLLAALAAAARASGERRRARAAVGLIGGVFALLRPAWVAYLALVAVAALRGRAPLRRDPFVASAGPIAVALTAVTHAVYFGGGRYSMVVFPLVTALAATMFAERTPRL